MPKWPFSDIMSSLLKTYMKKEIHPTYNEAVKVSCSCGNTWTTGSTKDNLQVEICAACHPFYTGKAKLVDTAGIVDKFKARMAMKEEMSAKRKGKKAKRSARAEKKSQEEASK